MTILLVDDDLDDALFLRAALAGIPKTQLIHEQLSHVAVQKLETGAYGRLDVIFLDINMPVINGWECLQCIKQADVYSTTPVVIYSTSSNPVDLRTARNLGASFYYPKPHTISALTVGLPRLIGRLTLGSLIQSQDKVVEEPYIDLSIQPRSHSSNQMN